MSAPIVTQARGGSRRLGGLLAALAIPHQGDGAGRHPALLHHRAALAARQ